jgi:hypothetical protein
MNSEDNSSRPVERKASSLLDISPGKNSLEQMLSLARKRKVIIFVVDIQDRSSYTFHP